MLRVVGKGLTSKLQFARSLCFSAANFAEEDKGTKAFLEKFMPNIVGSAAEPQFVSDFVKQPEKEQDGVPEKLTLNFYLPHKQQVKNQKVKSANTSIDYLTAFHCKDVVHFSTYCVWATST